MHDADNGVVCVDKNHIEFEVGVSHPKPAVFVGREDKQHAVIWGEGLAVHKPLRLAPIVSGDFHLKCCGACLRHKRHLRGGQFKGRWLARAGVGHFLA